MQSTVHSGDEEDSKQENVKGGDDCIPLLNEKDAEWSVEKLNKEFRKFNIDLHPRVRKGRSNGHKETRPEVAYIYIHVVDLF